MRPLLFLFFVVAVAGCSGSQDGKVSVSGTATWNGSPISEGYITFVNADPQKGKAAGDILNGKFALRAHPGTSRVEIEASREQGFNQGMNQPNIVPYIPLEYNLESTLSEEVTADGPNEFHIELTGEEPQ